MTDAELAPISPPPERRWVWERYRASLFGRSVVLLAGEVGVNLLLWIVAICLFAPNPAKRGVLSLCVVAWTLGLRHALDMDHIVSIDNATRNLVALNRLCVSTGTFFSLGHSTIVVAVTIAVIAATATLDHLDAVASVGGVIGVTISASFLLLLAVINSVSLWQTVRAQRRAKARAEVDARRVADATAGLEVAGHEDKEKTELDLDTEATLTPAPAESDLARIQRGLPATTCLGRLVRPVLRLIDRPYKMYPVGLLFGLGFDTASEITLLGVSALARRGTGAIATGEIIVLPLLFTAGMTLVDSCDSVFMLHAYALPLLYPGSGEGRGEGRKWWRGLRMVERVPEGMAVRGEVDRDSLPQWDQANLLTISIVLTTISILMAVLISVTEFMGLAIEECAKCAASLEYDPPTLASHWWGFWKTLNDNSGYLGVGVVAIFVLVFGGWAVGRRVGRRRREKAERACVRE